MEKPQGQILGSLPVDPAPRWSGHDCITGSIPAGSCGYLVAATLIKGAGSKCCAALLRSTVFSYCFLEHWVSVPNSPYCTFHNGDLLQTVLDIALPDLANRCRPLDEYRLLYLPNCLPCIQDVSAARVGCGKGMLVLALSPLFAGKWQQHLQGSATLLMATIRHNRVGACILQ